MEKKKIQSAGPHIRQAYYGISDQLGKLEDSTQMHRDEKANQLIVELRAKLNQLENHLNEEYLWD